MVFGTALGKNYKLQTLFPTHFDVPSETADTTLKAIKLLGDYEICDAQIVCPAGLAQSDTNYVVVSIIDVDNSNQVLASFSTKLTGGTAALTASFQSFVLGATADLRRAASGHTLAVFVDVTGAPTVPACRVVFHGRYRNNVKA